MQVLKTFLSGRAAPVFLGPRRCPLLPTVPFSWVSLLFSLCWSFDLRVIVQTRCSTNHLQTGIVHLAKDAGFHAFGEGSIRKLCRTLLQNHQQMTI